MTDSENTILNKLITDQSQRFDDPSSQANVTVIDCIFDNCRSDVGGALYIRRYCSVIIYGSVFKKCYAYDGAGGYICRYYYNRDDIKGPSELLKDIKIEYCCFF